MAGAMLDGEASTLEVPDRVTAIAEIRDQLQKLTDWHQTVLNDMVRDLDAANTRIATEQGPALEQCVRALLIDALTVEITAAFGTLGPLVGRVLRLGGLQGPKGAGPNTVTAANAGSVRTLLTARAIGAAQTSLTTHLTEGVEAQFAGTGPADQETLEAFFVLADMRFASAVTAAKQGAGRTQDEAMIAAIWQGLQGLDMTRFQQTLRAHLGTAWLGSQASPASDGFNKAPRRDTNFTVDIAVPSLDAAAPSEIVIPTALDPETASAVADQPGLWSKLPKGLRLGGELVATLGPSGEPIGDLDHGRHRRLYYDLLQKYGSREVASDYLRTSGSIGELAHGVEPSRASPADVPSYRAAFAQAAEYDASIEDAVIAWYAEVMGRVDASASIREIATLVGSRVQLTSAKPSPGAPP